MKYAEKYGVSRASRKYNKSRSYIYFWRQRWDGSVASLACQSSTPNLQASISSKRYAMSLSCSSLESTLISFFGIFGS